METGQLLTKRWFLFGISSAPRLDILRETPRIDLGPSPLETRVPVVRKDPRVVGKVPSIEVTPTVLPVTVATAVIAMTVDHITDSGEVNNGKVEAGGVRP